jgi:hypothetical protein
VHLFGDSLGVTAGVRAKDDAAATPYAALDAAGAGTSGVLLAVKFFGAARNLGTCLGARSTLAGISLLGQEHLMDQGVVARLRENGVVNFYLPQGFAGNII